MDLQHKSAHSRSVVRRLLPVVITTVLGLGAFVPLAAAATAAAPARMAAASTATASSATGGYQLVAADGGIFSFGDSTFYGSTGALALAKPIVGMAPTVSGRGYWMVASDGGVFSFGSAAFHGSTGGIALTKPIVGMAPTPSGHGYWLVASDGGVFAFGDAVFHGSAGALPLAKPIVGMTASATGGGYWLVASDGGVFSFGDAPYFGSAGALPLTEPIVGMAAPASGDGYWLVASDGGIFSFGNAAFYGSTGGIALTKPIVGMAPTPSGHGYWLVASDGGIFSFGDAKYFGSTGAIALNAPVVGMQATQPSSPPDAPSATQMAFSVQPGNSTGGTTFGANPTVQLQDAAGATVTGANNDVNLHLTTPAGATLACTANDVTAISGVATFTGCNINRPGTYTLTATSGALTNAVSTSSTITVGAPAKLAVTTQPSGGVSSTAFTTQPAVTVQDAGGNTVVGNTSSVTLAPTTPSLAVLGCTANPKAAVAGVATFTGCNIDLSGTYTLTAIDGALTSAVTTSFPITAGVATHLGFTTQPSGAASSTAFPTQPVVSVLDAAGNVATTNTSNVTVALTAAGGAVLACTGTTTKAAVAGVATFAGCNVNLANSYTLTATGSGLTSAVSTSFTIAVGGASQLAFTAQPSSSASSAAFATQPTVAIQDAAGNTVTSNTSSVTLEVTTPGGSAFACTTNPKPAVAGVAAFAGCNIDLAGTYTLTATDPALTTAVSTTFTITAGAATGMTFTTEPSASSVSSTDFTAQPVVTIHDAANNTVLTDNATAVALQLTAAGGASLSCGAPVTAAAGVAAFSGCNVNLVGTYTLTVTGPPLPTSVSSSFTITPGTATQLAFTTQPNDAGAGDTLGTQPIVTIRDAAGNTATGNTSSVTVALTSGGGGSINCTTNPNPAVGGIATFAGCSVARAGTYTLTASDTGLTTAVSTSFTITAGAATQLVFTIQPAGSPNGTNFATQPNVTIEDAFGNRISDPSSITLSLTTAGGATLACTTNPKPAVGGIAMFAGCQVDTAGSYTLTAHDGAFTDAISAPFNIT